MKYNHQKIEKKWQKVWDEGKMYNRNTAEDLSKEKFYMLDMFPYPSGDGLHMGHTESYTASDIMYRYKRLQGFDVLHPQGFDSFGLPAENYAIKTGVHPKETTKTNASNYIQQMKMLGLGHDLDHMVYTSDPSYYKWTQWIFGKFFENNLVEQKTSKINWCPSCNTGIANEQVESGKCERCKTEIEQREIPGWFFKITNFAEDLINDLDTVDWPEHTKKNQRNWIGKSEGAKIKFEIRNLKSNKINKNANVVMVHGCPSRDDDIYYAKHWQPFIKKQLEEKGVKTVLPLMPHPWMPVYKEHKKEFEKLDINEDSILVGHSCGANFLVRWLSETNTKIKKLILVAPWSEPGHADKEKAKFYDTSMVDYSLKDNIDEGVIIFTSNNEEQIGKDTAEMWADELDAKLIKLEDHGHYTESGMGTTEFPELLEEILRTVNHKPETSVEVFTTRPDTLFGVTYMVLAPEHELVATFLENKDSGFKNYEEVKKYIEKTKNKTEMERLESKEKTGVKLEGIIAINPANGEEIPIFVADYVLGGYGTGAIMAVPAHDERDYEFAKKYDIEIKQAIAPLSIDDTEESKPRPNLPFKKRNAITAIVKHWSEDKYLILDWKKVSWKTFITGGIEKNETAEEAARREILEETGYKNLRLIKQLKDNYSKFFHNPKNRNAFVYFQSFYFELESSEQKELTEEERAKHSILWLTKEEVDKVIVQKEVWKQIFNEEDIFTEKGILTNSGKFDGMDSEEAKKAIVEFVGGEMTTNYRLRDWSISRQRYWGCPIPIVYSPGGEAKFVGEENLPWLLPEDVDFRPDGTAPLAKSKELRERTEKLFGKGWTPEVDTMDTFVDSSWYFLRYPDTENEKEFCSPGKLKRWLPVDLYIGGAEHTYMHLLFARFFVKAMNKMGLIDFNEPFMKLRHQGMVLDKDGVKMSKSKGNVVNPNDMVEMFGADATRMYMMFATPLEDEIAFKQEGVKGVFRFLERNYEFLNRQKQLGEDWFKLWTNLEEWRKKEKKGEKGGTSKEIKSLLHKTIKKVTKDIEELKFNTAISSLMIFMNEIYKTKKNEKYPEEVLLEESLSTFIRIDDYEKYIILLAPFAPHLAEELWAGVGHKESIFNQAWPEYNPEMIQDDLIEMPIQVNGKVRDKIQVTVDISEEEAKEKALASEKVQKHIDGKEIKKVIFVKGRLISVVV